MRKTSTIKINLNELLKKNPNVDSKKLAEALQILGELQKQGVNIGPNYNLSSPFSRPEPHTGKTIPIGSTVRSK